MGCKAKLRNDIKSRGNPSIEFYFENKPRYFCYCPENVYMADEVMKQLKKGEKPIYDGLRNRTKKKKLGDEDK